MLDKEICRVCFLTLAKEILHLQTDSVKVLKMRFKKDWEEKGFVFCIPMSKESKFWRVALNIRDNPPKNCPYFLEYVLEEYKDVE